MLKKMLNKMYLCVGPHHETMHIIGEFKAHCDWLNSTSSKKNTNIYENTTHKFKAVHAHGTICKCRLNDP